MPNRYDAVIIGAGINGLVAAAMLSRAGKKVLVLEREDVAGGCMRTDEITDPGFHHDVMAATFVLFLTSPAYGALAEDLARHGLEFCHTPHPTAALRPDGSCAVLSTDRAANIVAFEGFAKGDGTAHRDDVTGIESDAEFLFALLGGPLWSFATAKLMARQLWKRGPRGLSAWIGRAMIPARGWLETTYASPQVQALYAPWVLHTGLTPEATYSGQMGKVIAFALEAAGAPVVKGGAGQAAAAFVSLIEAKGGEVRTGCEVAHINTREGRAVGVTLADGSLISAADVLASVAPVQLYGSLLDTPPAQDAAEAQTYRHGRGNFQLHYALDGQPDWIADGLDDVALIHLTDGIDAVSKSCNEALRGMLPAVPTICVGQPHRLDPTRCPEGKGILWLQIPDAPSAIKGDAGGTISGTDWDEATREAFADRIEDILRAHIRNFDAIKRARRAYSPMDLEAMNVNLVGGDPYGGQCSLDQFFVWRPLPGTPAGPNLRNLHHIGASAHPGPGLGGGSGFNAAKRLGA